MTQQDPNSNRYKKRRNRTINGKNIPFVETRPNRRAERRLDQRIKAYTNLSTADQSSYTKPGAIRHW